MTTTLKALAQTLKSLHKPGNPVIIANVFDVLSAQTVAALPSAKALGTASYGIARANSTVDDDLTLETNLAAVAGIGPVAREAHKPLTVDLQDGYGDRLEEAIRGVVARGGVGCNLEDCNKETHVMYAPDEAVQRITRALAAATAAGVPDFVVNARCDVLVRGGELEEVLLRGRKYLAAGATTVFVWGGPTRGGISRQEVERMIKEFDGRLNVSHKMVGEGNLTIKELKAMGVARISVGPQMQFAAYERVGALAEGLLKGGE